VALSQLRELGEQAVTAVSSCLFFPLFALHGRCGRVLHLEPVGSGLGNVTGILSVEYDIVGEMAPRNSISSST
jgi:hypothetical protein